MQLYPSGIQGDEKDVIRKMRNNGQVDASVITDDRPRQIVREATVLSTPGIINNYEELERVQKAMNKEWEDLFDKSGFKLIAWGEAGQYRYFSKIPIKRPADIKSMRPWLWPESYVMKEIYKIVPAQRRSARACPRSTARCRPAWSTSSSRPRSRRSRCSGTRS